MRKFESALWAVILAASLCLLIAACGDEDDDEDDYLDGDAGEDDYDPGDACPEDEGAGATSGHMAPSMPASYYVEQSLKYFDTLDTYADPASIPDYSPLVARWEWPPWLKLTGLGNQQMVLIDLALQIYPTSVPVRDCQAFDEQPFGRCHVVFDYKGKPCPIYEEFTFNERGEMTFIEAWSDLPGMLPTDDPGDYWAEGDNVHRLSTKVPGLGNAEGLIDLDGVCMRRAANTDTDVADFVRRAKNPIPWWLIEYVNNPESFDVGCGWVEAKGGDCSAGR